MSNNFIIVALVIFVLFGVVAYNQYLDDQGQKGPLTALVQSARKNLENYSDHIKPGAREVKAKEKIEAFKEMLATIESEQDQGSVARHEILESLLLRVQGFEVKVAEAADRITQQQQKLLLHQPKFSVYRKELYNIWQTKGLNDPSARLKSVNQRLTAELATVVPDVNEEVPRLAGLFNELTALMSSPSAEVFAGCPSDRAICVKRDVDQLEAEVDHLFSRLVEWPQRDLSKFLELTRVLEFEHRIFMKNAGIAEDELKENKDSILQIFNDLSEKLTPITEQDLVNLTTSYLTAQKKVVALVLNLQDNRKRLYEQHRSVFAQVNKILNSLEDIPGINVLDLRKEAVKFRDEQKAELMSFEENEKNISNNFDLEMSAYDSLIGDLLKQARVDLSQLEKKYSIEQQQAVLQMQKRLEDMDTRRPMLNFKKSSVPSPSESKRFSSSQPNSTGARAVHPDLDSQRWRQKDVLDQMDRRHQQAVEQGL